MLSDIRSAFVAIAEDKHWSIELWLNGRVQYTLKTSNYHEIGLIVSNWIANGIAELL